MHRRANARAKQLAHVTPADAAAEQNESQPPANDVPADAAAERT